MPDEDCAGCFGLRGNEQIERGQGNAPRFGLRHILSFLCRASGYIAAAKSRREKGHPGRDGL
jgi:hypothetical protein